MHHKHRHEHAHNRVCLWVSCELRLCGRYVFCRFGCVFCTHARVVLFIGFAHCLCCVYMGAPRLCLHIENIPSILGTDPLGEVGGVGGRTATLCLRMSVHEKRVDQRGRDVLRDTQSCGCFRVLQLRKKSLSKTRVLCVLCFCVCPLTVFMVLSFGVAFAFACFCTRACVVFC